MAITNITQLRRLIFRKWTGTAWSTFEMTPDDLGQDTVMSFNIAPRKAERATQMGTTNAPIPGTFDELSATATFLASDWKIIGKALDNWTASTYEGAASNAGQIIGDSSSMCAGTDYVSVIAQGFCDDGSSADVEFTRCIPSLDSDIEIGTESSVEVELALNPQIYNASRHSNDGYPAYTYRLGEYDTTAKKRLDITTGEYVAVNEG